MDVAIFGKVRVEFGILHTTGFKIVPVCLETPFDFLIDWYPINPEKVNLQILSYSAWFKFALLYSYNF